MKNLESNNENNTGNKPDPISLHNSNNQNRHAKFKEKAMSDLDGAWNGALVYIGDKLGLYKAMKHIGKPITSHELANLTKTSERNIREWLANQVAGGYVTYDARTQKYSLPMENVAILVDEDNPECIIRAFQMATYFYKESSKIIEAFKTDGGLPWGDHDPEMYQSVERLFKPVYRSNIASIMIPSLDNGRVQEKLQEGALVADIGCGHGSSTIIMAKVFPNSRFVGFDNHRESIEKAKELAIQEGLGEEQVRFEVYSANDYPLYPQINQRYDLITFFVCLHDMGDPVGAASHALESLKPDGTVMIVEDLANDRIEENLNPIGRACYAASTMICVPASMAENGPALGTQAGEAKIGEVMKAGGFRHFRRTTHTPFSQIPVLAVYEARL